MNLPKLEKTEFLYRGRIIDVSLSEARTAAGLATKIEIVHHPGGAGALPLFEDGAVILVNQFRFPLQRFSLEIPAGRIENNQSPEETARRELAEETGYQASQMQLLSAFYPTPGYCEEKLFVYLATELTESRQQLESDEEIELVRLPLTEAYQLVESGQIDDAKTIIALLQAKSMLK